MSESGDTPYLLRKSVVDRIVYALYAACAVSVALELFVHRHEKLGLAESFGFYAWYGLACCVALVLAAKGLRRLVARREDYYADPESGEGAGR